MIYTKKQWQGSARGLAAAVRDGEVIRAGRFYVTPDTDPVVVEALSEGLRPTCVTAAEHHGLWVPPAPGRHVYGRRQASVRQHWTGHGWHHTWPEAEPIASPALMLEHAAGCLDPLDVGILADSALHEGLLTAERIAAVAEVAPRAAARVLRRANGQPQSGTESKVRLFLQLHNVTVRPQVKIPGIGFVDNLVGRRWIVESDSRAHHTGEDTYAADRRRDLRALELGYFTTRLTHWMAFGGWPRTSQTMLRVIRSGRHLEDPAKYALV